MSFKKLTYVIFALVIGVISSCGNIGIGITTFSINGITGTISGTDITVVLPAGTNVKSLAPDITLPDGMSIVPASGEPQDFTTPVTYTVTSDESTKTYIVTVTLAPAPATLVSISVTPADPSVPDGATQQFTATGTYSDATTQNITLSVNWTSSDTNVATIVSTTGLATAVNSSGTSTITATLGLVSGTATLTANSATLVSIAVTPVNPSVANGLTQQFTATGTYSDGSHSDITSSVAWASSDLTKATIVLTTGLATAVAVGTSDITASLSGVTSPAQTLTVTPATLVSIAVTPVNPSVAKGLTQQFTATGTYTDGSHPNITSSVTWASSDLTKATIVSTTGLATAVAEGTSDITASLSGVTSPAQTLTVTPATLVSIAVTPVNPSVAKGLTRQFTAIGTYSDTTTLDITSSVTWASSDLTKATIVLTTGLATAVAVGTSNITASLSGITSPAQILTVTPAVLTSIAITPNPVSILVDAQQQFTATGAYSDGTHLDITLFVTWTVPASGASMVIDSNGLGTANDVAGGPYVIVATDPVTHIFGQANVTNQPDV